jgi:hypothetical protein
MFSLHPLMDSIKIDAPKNLEIDCIKLQKMAFIYNAVQSGWEVKLKGDKYVFSKKHEGKKEIYLEAFLRKFLEANMDISKIAN